MNLCVYWIWMSLSQESHAVRGTEGTGAVGNAIAAAAEAASRHPEEYAARGSLSLPGVRPDQAQYASCTSHRGSKLFSCSLNKL